MALILEEDGSEGIGGRVEKMMVLPSWRPVANVALLAPDPESSFHHWASRGNPQKKHSFDDCSACLLKVLCIKSHLIHSLLILKVRCVLA